MKASPGRGKLSPQVTDEGAPFAAACLYPSSVCSLWSQPPSPQGVKALATAKLPVELQSLPYRKAFAPGQVAKIGFRATQKTKSCCRAPCRKFLRGATICPAEAYQSGGDRPNLVASASGKWKNGRVIVKILRKNLKNHKRILPCPCKAGACVYNKNVEVWPFWKESGCPALRHGREMVGKNGKIQC